jgi:hypothetical protein
MADSEYNVLMNNNKDDLTIDINNYLNNGAHVIGSVKLINNYYVQTVTMRDFTFNPNYHLEYKVVTGNTNNHLNVNVNVVLEKQNEKWHCIDGASIIEGVWTQTLVKIWAN